MNKQKLEFYAETWDYWEVWDYWLRSICIKPDNHIGFFDTCGYINYDYTIYYYGIVSVCII